MSWSDDKEYGKCPDLLIWNTENVLSYLVENGNYKRWMWKILEKKMGVVYHISILRNILSRNGDELS